MPIRRLDAPAAPLARTTSTSAVGTAAPPAPADVERAPPTPSEDPPELPSRRFRHLLATVEETLKGAAPDGAPPSSATGPLSTRIANASGKLAPGLSTNEVGTLADAVTRLHAEGVPGVALWTEVTALAVRRALAREDLTVPEKYDAVVAALSYTLVSGAKEHLERYLAAQKKTLGRRDPHAGTMTELLRALSSAKEPEVQTVCRVDPTKGEDFRAAFRDDSYGQVGHTSFYVLLGYAAGGEDRWLAHLPNVFHETLDPSAYSRSYNDFLVGGWGVEIGRLFRHLRERGGEDGLRALPAIVQGAFGLPDEDGVRGAGGEDLSAIAREIHDVVTRDLERPVEGAMGRALTTVSGAAVRLFERAFLKRRDAEDE